MSGGSYEYLCWTQPGDLLHKTDQLEAMVERLDGLPYAREAANQTREVLQEVRGFIEEMDRHREDLAGVWKAVEWWDSGDSSEDDAREAIAEYEKKLDELVNDAS
jgi:Zn-dependent oligopeptidase